MTAHVSRSYDIAVSRAMCRGDWDRLEQLYAVPAADRAEWTPKYKARRPAITMPGGTVIHDFRVGDRVRVRISGRTGEIIKKNIRHNGWKVRWDEPVFGCTESDVLPPSLEPLHEEAS